MINGERYEKFDPAGDREVTDVLPTATGLYLEEIRKSVLAHFYECMPLKIAEEETDEYEVVTGSDPYRSIRHVPVHFGHPHQSWFK